MKLSKIDKIVCISSIICISILSFLLYREFTAKVDIDKSNPIGTIVYKNNITQRQYGAHVIWETIRQHETVYNFDSIRTGSNSNSVLKLFNGTEIELAENTLIRINIAAGDFSIDFTQGDITVAGSESFRIIADETTISAGEGALNLKKEDDALNLSVTEGTAIVNDQAIDQTRSAVITGNTTDVREKLFIGMVPTSGRHFISHSARVPIRFSWESTQQAPHSIEISSSRTFSSILVSSNVRERSFSTTLADGIYFWRIRTIGNSPSYSDIQSFTILNDNVLVPVSPNNLQNFSYVTSPPTVNISWTSSRIASSYELFVSRDPDFTSILQRLTPATASISITNITQGEYYWRVRPIYPFVNHEASSNFTATRKFTITQTDTVSPPVLVSPGDGAQVSRMLIKNRERIFSWEPANDVGKYEVQISTDENFSRIIRRIESSSLFASITGDLNSGTYYWRVVFTASDNRTYPSRVRSFNVIELEPLRPTQPTDNGLIDISSNNNVRFSWIDHNHLGNYRVEVYQNRELTQPLNSVKTGSTNAVISIDAKNQIFWRVVLLDNQDNVISTSSTFTANIAGSIQMPEFTAPTRDQDLDMSDRNSLQFSWTRINEASHYRLRLYQQLPQGPKLIFSNQVNTNSYTFTRLIDLNIGSFYAELEAVKSVNNVLQHSNMNRLYFMISLRRHPINPIITSPVIVYIR